jgi:hypothetical protein
MLRLVRTHTPELSQLPLLLLLLACAGRSVGHCSCILQLLFVLVLC